MTAPEVVNPSDALEIEDTYRVTVLPVMRWDAGHLPALPDKGCGQMSPSRIISVT